MIEKQGVGGVRAAADNVCSRCGAAFTCGMQAGWAECWCAALPAVPAIPDAAAGCYCPTCLKTVLGVSDGEGAVGDVRG